MEDTGQERDRFLTFRVSRWEYWAARTLAHRRGTSHSEVLRSLLREAAREELDREPPKGPDSQEVAHPTGAGA